MALKDALTTVANRSTFYRDGYRLLLRISIIQGLVILLLTAFIVAMLFSMETKHVFFATTSDGRIINIVPLNEPYRTRAEVVAWSASTAHKVMRLGYHDYRQRLQDSSNNFTPTGWESFTKAMKEARILETLEARKLVINMEIEAAPEVKNSFVKEGIYTWYLQFPVSIKFEGQEAPAPMRAMLILQVVRVSTLQNPDGISIEQWVAKAI